MAKASDRRGFFSEVLRSGLEIAQEVSSAMRTAAPGPEWVPEPEPWVEPRPVPAPPTSKPASGEDLAALCRELGLSPARGADVERVARPSIRLTRAAASPARCGASRLGGVPDVPAGFEWPRWGDTSLAFLGQIDLREAAALLPESPLPPSGLLLFFYAADLRPSGLEPGHRGSCRVVLAGEGEPLQPDPEGRASFAEYPLELSRELTLPPAYSLQVEPLGLEDEEFEAWIELRERLTVLQGVPLEERSTDWYALHRLLGHCEPVGSGEIELDCQLVTHGLDLSEGDGYFDARREELEPGAGDWRLLLQLSDDDHLGSDWADGFGRLFLWIREQDLRSGNFDAVWAIRQ
jgi:uncharacterized protein YwqG